MQTLSRTSSRQDTDRRGPTLAHVLRQRAARQPDEMAYRFLADGEARECCLSYGELDRRARGIAALLESHGAAGERALLVYPPGLELIAAWFGCACAGVVAVVLPAPHPARRAAFRQRLAAVVADAMPKIALTTGAIRAALQDDDGEVDGLLTGSWLATDTVADAAPEGPEPPVAADDLAFLQYTSGSTTAPKGVMVTHGSLMHNLRVIEEAFWRPGDGGSVSWLPPYHDMGLIGGILAPLFVGCPATLMSPLAFVQRPRRWLQAISRFGAAISGGPNFAYELCVQKTTPEQRAALDLSRWRVAFNGAEPVNAATLQAFAATFAPCGFAPEALTPCYGLAEATLLVSAAARDAAPHVRTFYAPDLERHRAMSDVRADAARALVSCGRPAAPTLIVDPESRRGCANGQIGEIWVAGSGVATGYWRQSTASEEIFAARLADGAGPFLRTGDLGFLEDGELFVTGRLKDLIIIDGSNHYPQDIEATAGASHPALRADECVAFALEHGGGEALVVVAALHRHAGVDRDTAAHAIRRAVSQHHDLHVHEVVLVTQGGIPRTTSGKIRRRDCRTAYLEGSLDVWETP